MPRARPGWTTARCSAGRRAVDLRRRRPGADRGRRRRCSATVEARITGVRAWTSREQTISLNDPTISVAVGRPAGVHRQGPAARRCSSRSRSAACRSACGSPSVDARGRRRCHAEVAGDNLTGSPSASDRSDRCAAGPASPGPCRRRCRSRGERRRRPSRRRSGSAAARRRSAAAHHVARPKPSARRVSAQAFSSRDPWPRCCADGIDDELVDLAVPALLGVVVRTRHGGGEPDHPLLVDGDQHPVAGPGRPGDGGARPRPSPRGDLTQHDVGQLGRQLGRPGPRWSSAMLAASAGQARRTESATGPSARGITGRSYRRSMV